MKNPCPTCNGTGRILNGYGDPGTPGLYREWFEECGHCDGTGCLDHPALDISNRKLFCDRPSAKRQYILKPWKPQL